MKKRKTPTALTKPKRKRKPTPMVELNVVASDLCVWGEFPIRLASELNTRGHWRKTYDRKKAQQQLLALMLPKLPRDVEPSVVRFVRIGPQLMDKENNAASFKHVQDEIARWLGVDDKHLDPDYDQRTEGVYGFELFVAFRRTSHAEDVTLADKRKWFVGGGGS